MTMSPQDLLLSPYNDLDYKFEDWSNLDDFQYTLSGTSDPLELDPMSPVSSCSSANTEDLVANAFRGLKSGESSSYETTQPRMEHHTLSQAEIFKLYAIAMPGLVSSPESSNLATPSPVLSPEATFEAKSQPQKKSKVVRRQISKPKAKELSVRNTKSHNMIEKRYRTNLNDKIIALGKILPNINGDAISAENGPNGETEPQKLKKATILSRATEFIGELETRVENLTNEHAALQSRLTAFEKLLVTLT